MEIVFLMYDYTTHNDIKTQLLSHYLRHWPSELDMVDALNGIIGTERGYITSADTNGTRMIRLETIAETSNGSLLTHINEIIGRQSERGGA